MDDDQRMWAKTMKTIFTTKANKKATPPEVQGLLRCAWFQMPARDGRHDRNGVERPSCCST